MTAVHPIVPVSDLARGLEHYRQLGFEVRAYDDGDDYGFVVRDRVELHLTYQPTSYFHAGAIACIYIHVDDADAVYAAWSAPGVKGETLAPADRPWRRHEGVHTDPDGNVIRFGSPIS
jgi:catechol 2,3-dioxygenase-like lactoylglutathione lyase family enzyme